MVHDYGFGYFVVSMRVEGNRKDSEQLYTSVNEIAHGLYKKYHCDCFIQIDYILDNSSLTEKIDRILQNYDGKISINDFRLIENGSGINIVFNILYPAKMQKMEEEICKTIPCELERDNEQYHAIIKGIIDGSVSVYADNIKSIIRRI